MSAENPFGRPPVPKQETTTTPETKKESVSIRVMGGMEGGLSAPIEVTVKKVEYVDGRLRLTYNTKESPYTDYVADQKVVDGEITWVAEAMD